MDPDKESDFPCPQGPDAACPSRPGMNMGLSGMIAPEMGSNSSHKHFPPLSSSRMPSSS